MFSGERSRGGWALWLLGLVACARENPAYGADSTTDSGGASGGQSGSASTTGTGTATGTGTGDGTSQPTGDDGTTGHDASSEDSTSDTETLAESTGVKGCELVIIDVDSDTFVSNAEMGCAAGSCSDWTFTGTPVYEVRTSGQLDMVMLLRFVPPEPLGKVESARVDVNFIESLPPGIGLFEVHVLDTTSDWEDGSTEGPIPGQPTFNEARRDVEAWTDGDGNEVPDFDALRDDWPTVPVRPGDDDDGVLEFDIQPEDYASLQERLSAAAPVIIGVTVLGGDDGGVSMATMDAKAFAELRVTVCR